MRPSPEPLLVLLTGPVGGGKTTVANALADVLREAGRVPGVIDLDLVYRMARQSEHFGDEETWRTARGGAAALADQFIEDGLDVVIVEGSFHNEQECDDVRRHMKAAVETKLFALNVTYDETARRVEADPATDRVVSRDPRVLKWLHSQFTDALPFLEASSVVIDADALSPSEIAAIIADEIT